MREEFIHIYATSGDMVFVDPVGFAHETKADDLSIVRIENFTPGIYRLRLDDICPLNNDKNAGSNDLTIVTTKSNKLVVFDIEKLKDAMEIHSKLPTNFDDERIERVVEKHINNTVCSNEYIYRCIDMSATDDIPIDASYFIRKPGFQIVWEQEYTTDERNFLINNYRKELEDDPGDADGYNQLANHLADVGLLTEAIETYMNALKLDPQNPFYHYNLALALRTAGRFDEAIFRFEKFIEFLPGDMKEAEEKARRRIEDMRILKKWV